MVLPFVKNCLTLISPCCFCLPVIWLWTSVHPLKSSLFQWNFTCQRYKFGLQGCQSCQKTFFSTFFVLACVYWTSIAANICKCLWGNTCLWKKSGKWGLMVLASSGRIHMPIAFHRNCSPQSKIFCKTSLFLAKAGPSAGSWKSCLPGHLSEETKSWETEGTKAELLVTQTALVLLAARTQQQGYSGQVTVINKHCSFLLCIPQLPWAFSVSNYFSRFLF